MIKRSVEKLAVKLLEKDLSKNVNSACQFWLYQPRLPDSLVKKFRKE